MSVRELPTAQESLRAPWELAGLTPEEYEEICRRLGREPNPTELAMFGVMWSEHCSYKHSRIVLQALPTSGPRILRGPGENAGVIDIGDGWAVAFKMESHNHPSAVDPFNGAATGVGGIIRDILAMGARPIALLDSLRFGPLEDPRARRMLRGVVCGISTYGNDIGVPTVGGEVETGPWYTKTPLVNVACLGLLRVESIATSRAQGPGNLVMVVGARTGRDGIHGASFASAELDEGRDERSSVQIGDPFTGKLLIEATLEALATGSVVAIQDMGAAGLTCAASEMAARGGVGMVLDLEHVPRRETGMEPVEVLLSESQERMLMVIRRGAEERIKEIFRRWGLEAEVLGEVVREKVLRVSDGGTPVAELPPEALAEGPRYKPEAREPAGLQDFWPLDLSELPEVPPGEALLTLLADPDIASKEAIYEQYDHMVQLRTVILPGADAAVLRLPECPSKALALAVDGKGRYGVLDPYRAAVLAVSEAAANLACCGAQPLGVTDCLNFANPEDPEVFWTFVRSVEGLSDACRALDIPIIGGNVSFYNESSAGPIPPTVVVAMVGLLEDAHRIPRIPSAGFAQEGDRILLVGSGAGSQPPLTLGGSCYLKAVHGQVRGRPPEVDLSMHRRLLRLMIEAVRRGLVRSSHDCSDGGFAVALAECCILGRLGAHVQVAIPEGKGRREEILFGEGGSRILLSTSPEAVQSLLSLAAEHDVPVQVLGVVGGDRLVIGSMNSGIPGQPLLDLPVRDLEEAWRNGFRRWMEEA